MRRRILLKRGERDTGRLEAEDYKNAPSSPEKGTITLYPPLITYIITTVPVIGDIPDLKSSPVGF